MNMKYAMSVVVFFLLVVSSLAQEIPSAGAYPIVLFTNKPLAVGTPVWANVGDSECAYPGGEDKNKRYFPIGERHCFDKKGSYLKAKIKSVELTRMWGDNHAYTYTIEFDILLRNPTNGDKLTRRAFFDEAMRFYNLPADLASYSVYFVRLNW